MYVPVCEYIVDLNRFLGSYEHEHEPDLSEHTIPTYLPHWVCAQVVDLNPFVTSSVPMGMSMSPTYPKYHTCQAVRSSLGGRYDRYLGKQALIYVSTLGTWYRTAPQSSIVE